MDDVSPKLQAALENAVLVDREDYIISRRSHRLAVAAVGALIAFTLFVGSLSLYLAVTNRDRYIEQINLQGTVIKARGARLAELDADIRAKDKRIDELKGQLDDATYVLNEQAVPAILRLAAQVKRLGGDPGEVVLKAPPHPRAP